MLKYILKRLGIAILVLLGVSIIIYMLVRLMPSDFVDQKYQPLINTGQMAPERLDELKELYGIADRSFRGLVRGYGKWMWNLLHGDLGLSFSYDQPVGEIIGEAVKVHKIVPAAEHKQYVLKIMEECGLPAHYYDRYPHEFSGGQRQRICIARSLALQPELIICDEPVSALDVSIQAQIMNLLRDLQEKQSISYIFISHDLSVVRHISDEVGVMYLGSMVEYSPTEDIFESPLHPYTEALLSAVPVPDPAVKMNHKILTGDIPSPANPPSGCKFHTRCEHCTERCKCEVPELREVKPGHFVACHLYDGKNL